MKKLLTVIPCLLLLSACSVPALVWEEEGEKVVEDIVAVEEKLHPEDVKIFDKSKKRKHIVRWP